MRFVILTSWIFLLCGSSLPPIGKRLYIVNQDDPAKPQKILPTKGSEATAAEAIILKDPGPVTVQPFKQRLVRKQAPKPKFTSRVAKLSFKSLPVAGRISNPRMDFRLERLRVGQAEEGVKTDFLDETLRRDAALSDFR